VGTELLAPSRIPKVNKVVQESATPPSMEGVVEGLSNSTAVGISSVIGTTSTGTAVVRPAPPEKVSRPSGVMAGYLLEKTVPQYPAIAKATHVQGVVVVQATISKTGLIENIRVISGPPLLQQAAVDAVRSWRYKPYLLNGEPVEVETTVNVVFNLGE
jgi:periplasmic protein TonB